MSTSTSCWTSGRGGRMDVSYQGPECIFHIILSDCPCYITQKKPQGTKSCVGTLFRPPVGAGRVRASFCPGEAQ